MRFAESELRIVRCALEGRSNSEIAAKEGLEEAEVAAQIDRVLTTLGLRERIELFFFAATREGQDLFRAPAARKTSAAVPPEPTRKSG